MPPGKSTTSARSSRELGSGLLGLALILSMCGVLKLSNIPTLEAMDVPPELVALSM